MTVHTINALGRGYRSTSGLCFAGNPWRYPHWIGGLTVLGLAQDIRLGYCPSRGHWPRFADLINHHRMSRWSTGCDEGKEVHRGYLSLPHGGQVPEVVGKWGSGTLRGACCLWAPAEMSTASEDRRDRGSA